MFSARYYHQLSPTLPPDPDTVTVSHPASEECTELHKQLERKPIHAQAIWFAGLLPGLTWETFNRENTKKYKRRQIINPIQPRGGWIPPPQMVTFNYA